MLRDKFVAIRCVIDHLHPMRIVFFVVSMSFLLFALTPNTFTGGDSPSTIYLPASLIRHGTLRLDPYVNRDPLFDLSRNPHWIVESNGHYYSKFSPITSLLVAPLYGLYFILAGFPQEIVGASVPVYFLLARMSTMLLAIGVEVVVFLLLRRFVRQSTALFLTLAYAFSTYTWNWATSSLTTTSTAELCIALGLLAILRMKPPAYVKRRFVHGPLFLAGLFLSISLSARPQTVLVVLILSVYVLWRSRESPASWLSYVAGALPALAFLLLYNRWAFGSLIYTGYSSEAVEGWRTPLLQGLAAILISPSHSLLVYSPTLLLGFLGGLVVWHSTPMDGYRDAPSLDDDPHLLQFVSVAVWAQLLLMSRWWAWHGGVAYNQRMVQEIHSLLIFLTCAVLVRRYGRRRWFVIILLVASGWGYLMNLISKAFYAQHLTWVERPHPEIAWSWAHMEALMYLKWHGIGPFMLGVVQMVSKTSAVIFISWLAFWFLWLRHRPARNVNSLLH